MAMTPGSGRGFGPAPAPDEPDETDEGDDDEHNRRPEQQQRVGQDRSLLHLRTVISIGVPSSALGERLLPDDDVASPDLAARANCET